MSSKQLQQMKMNSQQYIEAIKLAVGSVQYRGLSVQKVLEQSISQLYDFFRGSQNEKFLETALLQIQAYLEMGFSYDDNEVLFDEILSHLDLERESCFPKRIYVAREVRLNRNAVRSMIGRWQGSSKQTMKIDEVVTDIIDRVTAGRDDICYYRNEVTQELYELVINGDEIFFHDVQRGLYYTFVQA